MGAAVTKAKGRHRIEQRLADMGSNPAEDDPPWEPDRHLCNEELSTLVLEPGSDQLIACLEINPRGLIVSFSITRQLLIDGEWRDLVRADTAHSSVHIHLLDGEGGTIDRIDLLKRLTCMKDVRRGYDLAHAAIFDHPSVVAHLRR